MAFSPKFLIAVAALVVGVVDAQQCTGRAFSGPCLVVGTTGNCPTPGDVCDQSIPPPTGPQCCAPAGGNPGGNTGGNTGGNGNCVDKGSNCAQNANLCRNNLYQQIMSDNCAATCGLCSGGAGAAPRPVCVDSNPNCVYWNAKQFCTSSFYTDAQKRQFCQKTCGYCTP